MAATDRRRSPQRHEGPIPARADRMAKRPHPVRLRRDPPAAVGGSRRTPTRRPPRRRPVVAHPRPTTANPTRKPQGCASDQAPDCATAALEAASGVGPEPLSRLSRRTAAGCSAGSVAQTSLRFVSRHVCSALVAPWSATWHCYLVLLAPPDTSWCTAWSQAGEGSRERLRKPAQRDANLAAFTLRARTGQIDVGGIGSCRHDRLLNSGSEYNGRPFEA